MRSTEEKVGSSSYQVVGLPLHEMSEDQLDAYDALLMERNGLAVDLDRYKEIMTEERAQSGELRAAAKEGRSIAKDKLFWFEKRRGEAERNIGVSAYRTVASSFGQDLQVLVRNLKDGAVKPEEVRANFAEISMQVDQSVENLMAFDPQGNPTGVPAGVIKETQDKVRETMLAPVERLLASEPEAYKAALELATNSDRLTLTRELPLHVAIGTTFPSIASTPAFTNSLLRSTTDTEKALTIALDKEVGALGDQLLTRLEATQKATEGVVEGASPQNRAQVLGASVSLLSEINRPGSGLARDVATNPRSKTAFLNLIKNTARHYEGLSAIGRKQAFDRIMGGSGFLTALQSLPEAQRADAAEAALNILRLDLLEYGSRYAAYRESVVYNEDTGDFEPTAQNATLAEYAKGANERLDLARQLNAFSTKMDEDVFLEYVFKIEPPKEESETQK